MKVFVGAAAAKHTARDIVVINVSHFIVRGCFPKEESRKQL
jgi:hypothetical protein|tara:strand:+ start:1864 stop:1986 length:123 start_codon:yes stop_codon:yes gene_type:complete